MLAKNSSHTRIGIIDDDKAYVQSFYRYFNTSKQNSCIFSALSLPEVFEYKPQTLPVLDVLFLDILMPEILGTEGLLSLKKHFPKAEIIMLTVVEDEHQLLKALCSGAGGYLLKEVPFIDIENHIGYIQRGEAALSPKMARHLVTYFGPKQSTENEGLSSKNLQVLHLLAEGWAYKTIADRMGISIDGVRYHIKEIYRMLNVQSVAQAVRKYIDGDLPTR